MPFFEALADKFADHDVRVLNVYVREPHAGERAFRSIRHHQHYEQKLGYARDLARTKGMRNTVLVDDMDERVHRLLGDLPNVVYVVGKDGRVKYKATWADAEFVDEHLVALVNSDPELADRPRLSPTIFTQDAPIHI